jgi:lipopolysaccharide export system protein LptA
MTMRLLLVLMCAFASLAPTIGQIGAGARIKDFQAPSIDNTGRRSLIKGADAEAAGGGVLKITGPHVDNYRADGALDSTIEAKECFFNVNGNKDVWSDKDLSMKTADGHLALKGIGFRWTAANSQLNISNKVDALVRREALAGAPAGTNVEYIRISADALEYRSDSAIFSGHVVAIDSDSTVRCQTLKVLFDEKNNPKQIEAIDDVILTQKETEARGSRALYVRTSGLLRLTEKTRWRMGDREGESEILILDRARNTLRAENNVRMTLPSSFVTTNALAATTNVVSTNKIRISADVFDFAQTNTITHGPIAIFNGSVRAIDPQANLNCELLTIFFDRTNRLARAIAERDVQIVRTNGTINGTRAVFENGEITVEGQPKWRLDQKNGSADLLVFNPRTREVRALKNVRMELPAGSATNLFQATISTNASTNVIVITAAYFTNENNIATFSDHVRVSDPRGQIDANQITLFFNATNKIERVVAEGDVILTEQKSQAIGQRAEYTEASGKMRLTGAPKMFSEDRVVVAREFVVDRAHNTFEPLAPFRIEVRRTKRN